MDRSWNRNRWFAENPKAWEQVYSGVKAAYLGYLPLYAEGDYSKVYWVDGILGLPHGVAIKEARVMSPQVLRHFKHEEEVLKAGNQGQRWLATLTLPQMHLPKGLQHPETKYLVSTYTGEALNRIPNLKWDKDLFQRICEALLKTTHIHADLHAGNLTLQDGVISVIDWGKTFSTDEPWSAEPRFYLFKQPRHYPVTNLRMFETATVYARAYDELYARRQVGETIDETQYAGKCRKEFKDFLEASSVFYRDFCPNKQQLASYEKRGLDWSGSGAKQKYQAIARILKNPPNWAIRLEAERIQCLYDVERDYYAYRYHGRSRREHFHWLWNAVQHSAAYKKDIKNLHEKFDTTPSLFSRNQQLKQSIGTYLAYHQTMAEEYLLSTFLLLKEAIKPFLPSHLQSPPKKVENFEETMARLGNPKLFDELWDKLLDVSDNGELKVETHDPKSSRYYHSFQNPDLYNISKYMAPPISLSERVLSPSFRLGMGEKVPFSKNTWTNIFDILKQIQSNNIADDSNVRYLGRGANGAGYHFEKVPGYPTGIVVKRLFDASARQQPTAFSKEITALRNVDRARGQRYVACVQLNGEYFLLTTHAGEPFGDRKWTSDLFKSTLNELLYWDKLGITHWDLHRGNLVYDPKLSKVYLIDFEQYHQAKCFDTDQISMNGQFYPLRLTIFSCSPGFPPNNLLSFKTHALFGGWYDDKYQALKKANHSYENASELRNVFSDFLTSSARYYEKFDSPVLKDAYQHYDWWLQGMRSVDLKKPSDEVFALEAASIQPAFDHERAYHAFERNHRSLKEFMWWSWNAYQHAERYSDMVFKLLKNPVKGNPDFNGYYLTYHRMNADFSLGVTQMRLLAEVEPFLPKGTRLDLEKISSFQELWHRIGEPDDGKPFDALADCPDQYDFAGQLIETGKKKNH